MMPMPMTFNTSAYLNNLLFKTWVIKGWTPCSNSTYDPSHACKYFWQSMAFAIIMIFFLAIATEALGVLRFKLHKMQRLNPLKKALESSRNGSDPINQDSVTSSTSLLAPLRIPSSVGQIKNRRVRFHIAQSFLYMIYRFSGYILMLAAMTYNTPIFLTVILGLGVGYFFLAPIRQPQAGAMDLEDSHAHGSRHRAGRGALNESGTHGYSYGSL